MPACYLCRNGADDWRDAIRKSIALLERGNFVTADYKEGIIANVEKLGPYICIAPHVAIPHARPEQGAIKTQIAVTLFRNEVTFTHEDAKANLFITLSAADADSHLQVLVKDRNARSHTQKADSQAIIKGTIKTILGFIVLGAGAGVVQQSIVPFGDLFQPAFDMHGVVPNNEAIVSMGLTEYAVQTSAVFALGMCMNIVLARFSRWKYIFLTGHHALYMACLITSMLNIAGLEGWQLTVGGAILLGFVMSMFPALMQPTPEKITGEDSLALGHFGSSCYFISAQIGKFFAGGKSSEEVSFPKGLSFLRDNTISIAIVMFFCYIVVAGVAEFGKPDEAAKIWGESNRIVFSVLQSITFSTGIYIVLAGVRLLIAEIVPAFKGISEELIPNSKPAIDCPIVFPYAPNAVLIGFLSSFIGGIVGLAGLAAVNQGGIAAAIILPGAVVHFFCGATAGVCGNATGGLKGCVAGAFVHGIMVTFLAAALLPVLGTFGFANTTFSDADFTVVGIIFGNIAKAFGGSMLFGLIVVLFIAPIIYNFVAPKPAVKDDSADAFFSDVTLNTIAALKLR